MGVRHSIRCKLPSCLDLVYVHCFPLHACKAVHGYHLCKLQSLKGHRPKSRVEHASVLDRTGQSGQHGKSAGKPAGVWMGCHPSPNATLPSTCNVGLRETLVTPSAPPLPCNRRTGFERNPLHLWPNHSITEGYDQQRQTK